uniref:Protein kinase domain-containing protein n=1 Tax=Setaria digitata TaxID=48799 RepID=A0A915PWZ1_9BILA
MTTQCADNSNGIDIKVGQYITCKTAKYVVMEKIGQGGYGAVYRVKLESNHNEEYAMKVEQKLQSRERSKLNMELHLLKLMSNQPHARHFTKIINRAEKLHFFLIVMTLLGESLAELKRQYCPPIFSLATSLGVSIQCLEGIEQLHKVGFIHRDIKPGNFAIGLPPNMHVIYILDFGIARKYTNSAGDIKGPRCKVAFKGTVRYAALACHRGKELGPKDDCESWLYMMVDYTNPNGLTWKQDKERKKVETRKVEARTSDGKKRLFENMSEKDMSDIMDYIDKLDYQDRVDYQYLYGKIRKAALTANVQIDEPYDWEMQEEPDDEERASKRIPDAAEKNILIKDEIQQKRKVTVRTAKTYSN